MSKSGTIKYTEPYCRNDDMYSWNGKVEITSYSNGITSTQSVSISDDDTKEQKAEKIADLIATWIEAP